MKYLGIIFWLAFVSGAFQVTAQAAGGVELSDMTLRQMEKIEELYLHVIGLNRRIGELEAENTRLKSAETPNK
ncbi:MAG: hypothetical protein NW241_09620 [Bacteroidia bacterium]|nr:hypothetical protein [Bacteroidia bacterium]